MVRVTPESADPGHDQKHLAIRMDLKYIIMEGKPGLQSEKAQKMFFKIVKGQLKITHKSIQLER